MYRVCQEFLLGSGNEVVKCSASQLKHKLRHNISAIYAQNLENLFSRTESVESFVRQNRQHHREKVGNALLVQLHFLSPFVRSIVPRYRWSIIIVLQTAAVFLSPLSRSPSQWLSGNVFE